MIIDEIKTIASELSDMSPKTQLEIVKLCKNICLKMKDYIVNLDENVIADIDTRLENVESELTVAEGNIQANANAITELQTAITNINSTISELNTALQTLDNAKVDKTTYNAGIATLNQAISALQNQIDNKLNIASLILSGASGTLSSAELTTIQNNTDVIIKHGDDTLIKCDVDNGYLNFVGRVKSNIVSNLYVQITQDVISINLSTGVWTFTASAIVSTYNRNQLDTKFNAKSNFGITVIRFRDTGYNNYILSLNIFIPKGIGNIIIQSQTKEAFFQALYDQIINDGDYCYPLIMSCSSIDPSDATGFYSQDIKLNVYNDGVQPTIKNLYDSNTLDLFNSRFVFLDGYVI